MFELVLMLHQVQMRGELILHVIHIVGTGMIESGIDGLYRGSNLGRMTRVLNTLQFVPLDKEVVARSTKLESWIRMWWRDSLNSISAKDWFQYKGDTAETSLELLLESRLQRPYNSNVMVVPRLMKLS